ncbi:MAG: Trehalose/maltose import ATP-binding protein MalK [Candidatus Methanofastidiosum methylothiophilum]|uniref:Trehalose/maltose import ATP-binding protein MalK n=1 Tax=Candidatus Methanofastidiosum methylothiophilum TaxID=1705564 RepID=A0A150IXQ3_9EURY|nr:MAG: Trehalose/maltose import ATP-binding protein MalK [Candidatus Methanofastidiosum methylthiophilus]KYC47294.1 MAG: Trehalose/maltose import ATP-binding protein MalK [Candidatus Methanofastidiosum methylthiophilus]KYC49749.1 MAG: Trehalose/maltose import ATP-binding protein MalK [Candidatus Methanofastidiosum methylthiophilus]
MINIKDFSFSYFGENKKSLEKINLSVNKGEFIVINGDSGCGKSTLALCIGGFLRGKGEKSGSLEIDGLDVFSQEIFEISKKVGIIQQDPEGQICTLRVKNEVAFGLENLRIPPKEIKKKLGHYMKMVGIQDFENRDIFSLSGGEKQKVAIASVMAMEPEILIFDEPTSNLDPVATKEIFRTISEIKKKTNITIIVIEHKLGYLEDLWDRIVYMEKGKIRNICKKSSKKNYFSWNNNENGYLGKSLIDINGLTFEKNGKTILSNISLSLKEGEVLSIIGKNGSGKTTLLLHLLGIYRPTVGEVRIMGEDTRNVNVSKLSRNVGYVFQNPNHQIFEETVWKELNFGPKNFGINFHNCEEILNDFQLNDYQNKSPQELSFGEKRRLNIASIKACDPKIIVLDEPFVGQDDKNTELILKWIDNERKKGKIIIYVSHDPRILSSREDRILFLEEGKIVVDGKKKEVISILRDLSFEEFFLG